MTAPKHKFLEKEGLLNHKPERVSFSLFHSHDFFDPLDLPQVRYELLRSARVEGFSVSKACELFGFSREYFYKLERSFLNKGYLAMIGAPAGRRPLLALNQELISFIVHRKLDETEPSAEDLRCEIQKIYKVECSKRTIERIVEKVGLGKKRRNIS